MINNISIKDFQSHKNTELDFHDGVNSIIGSSNSGKTAILRALNLVLNNRPGGISFIRNGQEECKINVNVNNKKIKRLKSKKENKYFLDGQELNAVGRDVPEQVKEVFNFSEVNFQKQMDAPFLLSESPGEVARFLNGIIKLDQIDTWFKKINSKKRDCNANIKNWEAEKEEAEKIVSSLNWIDEAEELAIIASDLESEIEEKEKVNKNLYSKISEVEDLRQQIVNIDYETADKIITEIDAVVSDLVSFEKEKDELRYNIDSISDLKDSISNIPDIDSIESQIELINKEIEKKNELSESLSDIKTLIVRVESEKNLVDEFERDIKYFQDKLPDTCPLCGKRLEE